MAKVRKIILQDPQQGEVKVAFPLPSADGNPYGVFSPLQGTYWQHLLPLVSNETLNHALHGWATPLVRERGPSGLHLAKKVEEHERSCAERRGCPMAGTDCFIGQKKLPICFKSMQKDPDKAECIRQIALLWTEGFSVIVIVDEGEEGGQ